MDSIYVSLKSGKSHLVRNGQALCGTALGNCAESKIITEVSCKRCIQAETKWRPMRDRPISPFVLNSPYFRKGSH